MRQHLWFASGVVLSTIGLLQAQQVQSENLFCGGIPLFAESVTALPGPVLGVDLAADTAPGVVHVACFDLAARCAAYVPGQGVPMGERRNSLMTDPTGLTYLLLPQGPFRQTIPLPLDTALLNLPFVVQFLRVCPPGFPVPAGAWDYGPSFDVVLAGIPVPRDARVPPRPTSERQLFGEQDLRWEPFDVTSPRYSRLVPFQSGPLPNGAGLVLSGVSYPAGSRTLFERVAALALLVGQRWGHQGYQLRMTSAKREPGGANSYHQYGRSVDLSLADAAGNKLVVVPTVNQARHLDRLSRLAAEAGFDWLWHEPGDGGDIGLDHLHASVHTGGPVVTIDRISPGVSVSGSTDRRWQVTVTVADPDGVWQVFAEATQFGQPIAWGAAGFDPNPRETVASTPPTTRQFTFDVTSNIALNANGQATLHVWARDTFGSVAIDPAQAAPRTPRTTTGTLLVLNLANNSPSMVFISAGTFAMGSNASIYLPYWSAPQERPLHQVTISRVFGIGRYEVTQAEYLNVMGTNPSYHVGTPYPNSPRYPVENVSRNDAMAYCAALTTREATAGQLPAGYEYRLPTEAEWEYCCRAGTTTEFHYGPSLVCGQASFSYSFHSNSPCPVDPVAVGSYAPNAWGLHDMHGNVWEWCLDRWDGSVNYPSTAVIDPYVSSGPYAVLRGGGYTEDSRRCRSAFRMALAPTYRDPERGFRVVLAPVLVP